MHLSAKLPLKILGTKYQISIFESSIDMYKTDNGQGFPRRSLGKSLTLICFIHIYTTFESNICVKFLSSHVCLILWQYMVRSVERPFHNNKLGWWYMSCGCHQSIFLSTVMLARPDRCFLARFLGCMELRTLEAEWACDPSLGSHMCNLANFQ